MSLKGSQRLSRVLKDRSIDKYYFTIVKGIISASFHETAYISKDEFSNKAKVISDSVYKSLSLPDKSSIYDKIETEFIPLCSNKGYTLLKVKLITGKSHQIRAHLYKCGYPIIGDVKYGDLEVNRFFRDRYKLKNQLLHAGVVILSDNNKIMAPLPQKFAEICDGLGLQKNF